MDIELWWIGKTKFPYLDKGISDFTNRLKHYTRFNIRELSDNRLPKSAGPGLVKDKEAAIVLEKIGTKHVLVLLDERGQSWNSIEFSAFIQDQFNYSPGKTLVFLIGGAYGFGQSLYERADYVISLSQLTFSHQLVRLIFLEQLYRAFTIIQGEKYHNA